MLCWVVTTCRLAGKQERFRETHCLHLQLWKQICFSEKIYISTSLHDNTTQNTHASCLGSPRFKSRRWGDRLSWLRFSWFSTVPPGECCYSILKLSHNRFLPNHFHFIIHLPHSHSTLYIGCVTEKASLNKLQNIYTQIYLNIHTQLKITS
jgi:hypothetical protein